MRKVRRAAALALTTSTAAAAIAIGVDAPAQAAALCWPLAHASIDPPSGSITAGSDVHVSATVSGMLLGSHLQISGPGLNEQVGESKNSGTISGDVTVNEAGYFTLAVIGDGTKCTYDTSGFSVSAAKASSSPTPHKSAKKSPKAKKTRSGSGAAGRVPSGTGGGSGSIGDLVGATGAPVAGGTSPFTLPSVAPDGSMPGFRYPTPEPQVAAPPAQQPLAHDTAATTPVKWGQSIAAALILLLLSAHFGMWSRRQRLAAEARGGAAGSGPAGGRTKRSGRASAGRANGATATTATTRRTGQDADTRADVARDARGGYRGRRRRS